MIFALIPGMPKISFVAISVVTGALAFALFRSAKKLDTEKEKASTEVAAPEESIEAILPLDTLELEVGYGLIRSSIRIRGASSWGGSGP